MMQETQKANSVSLIGSIVENDMSGTRATYCSAITPMHLKNRVRFMPSRCTRYKSLMRCSAVVGSWYRNAFDTAATPPAPVVATL